MGFLQLLDSPDILNRVPLSSKLSPWHDVFNQ